MKEKILYCIWVILYAICAALGFMGEVFGAARVFLVILALAFFVPGFWLLVLGHQQKNKKILRRVRLIAIISLVLTLTFLIANMAVAATESTNLVLHILLVILSCPMICGQYWVLSLFGWASLLFAGIHLRKKT